MSTKYPILLVHGLGVKDVFFAKTFGNIDKNLQKQGFIVYKSKIDAYGSVENNAKALKKEVELLCGKGAGKVNIIAHSKGGLDAKYMIENLDAQSLVASLTTLCTPHKGSPVASGFLKLPTWLLKIMAFFVNLWYKILGDKHPDALTACKQLALSDGLENNVLQIESDVYCQSYSSALNSAKDDFLFSVPFLICHYYEKDKTSDGLVSSESAMFENYRGHAVEGSISHGQIVDFMAGKDNKEKIYAFYTALCDDLAKRGL